MATEILEIFNAENGIVSCVGAGGKKTTMFRLAEAHSGRVGITATAHIEYFPKSLKSTNYIADESELFDAIRNDKNSKSIAFAKPSERFGRRAGVSQNSIQIFKDIGNFDLLVIKADGARGRFIKAPAEHEPAIVSCSNTVIPILSSKVIGLPLTDEIAHRVDQISKVTGLKEGEIIKPIHVARLLSSSEGSLKNTGTAKVIPLINMVDDGELEKLAREAAKLALQMTNKFDIVVLASMKKDQPIVDVITR
ncbi:MAG TPA: putative selenium-dependent hydroxylase accessory protein YqeC [Thiotrichaceae bacterium]|jgi:probable selenium-dependent hydroxylase accessory protein YqeC|nr:putative selenium-dependent hydroxylase accessory protein YqeC [Thiotrichaceae bacterium]HIM07375.1 putative selenium-dependent hydroxylase accessory protein YqeC [Gammaproteobacteria bacterium]